MSFADSRARQDDVQTSKHAAVFSVGSTACSQRAKILEALRNVGPMKARELSKRLGIDFVAVNRRMSEIAGISRTGEKRDGCCEWAAVSVASKLA